MSQAIVVAGDHGEVEFKPYNGVEPAQPATAEAIDAFEAAFGRPLPSAYRKYLERINGGTVEPRGFRYQYTKEDIAVLETVLEPWDDILTEDASLVHDFRSLGYPKKGLDLEHGQTVLRRWARPDLLAFANTISGDLLVLDLAEGADYGSVKYLTIHGVAALDEGTEVPLATVAPDFNAFVRGLFDYDSEVERRANEVLQGRAN